MEDLLKRIPEIEKKITYTFHNKKLLILAFIHRSFYNENRTVVDEHNERLEFLGDSVLGLLISDYLYHQLPEQPEGELSQLRAHLVEATTCVRFLQKLDLAEYVLLGRGERENTGRGRETILADLFEALIGAVYIDGGISTAKQVFWNHFGEEIATLLKAPAHNWKAELQDYSQKKYQKPPLYKVEKEVGPDHSKEFHVIAYLADQEVGRGSGSSKKEAEQAAAEDALKKLHDARNSK
jgi:ribonuclease-3